MSFAFIFALATASPAFAGFSVQGTPKVLFNAEGSPGFLTFVGETKQLTLKDDGSKLTFTVPVDTITTGIELRDDHMRKTYVQTDKFPNVVLTLDRAAVQWPADGSNKGTAPATFEIHGVTKDVTVTYSIKKGQRRLSREGELPVQHLVP